VVLIAFFGLGFASPIFGFMFRLKENYVFDFVFSLFCFEELMIWLSAAVR